VWRAAARLAPAARGGAPPPSPAPLLAALARLDPGVGPRLRRAYATGAGRALAAALRQADEQLRARAARRKVRGPPGAGRGSVCGRFLRGRQPAVLPGAALMLAARPRAPAPPRPRAWC
jgi:hypothetical protein